jgi:hypothetical protein
MMKNKNLKSNEFLKMCEALENGNAPKVGFKNPDLWRLTTNQ